MKLTSEQKKELQAELDYLNDRLPKRLTEMEKAVFQVLHSDYFTRDDIATIGAVLIQRAKEA